MIHTTEVDGVPALFAPSPGPTYAGLTFRVGQADESLPRRGITHLVEHLALFRHGVSALHFNGVTAPAETHFVVQGGPQEVVRYFAGVCGSLADLPLERLETEKAILRSEAAGRPYGPLNLVQLWRHGARDFGLLGYPEFGIDGLAPDEVRAWVARWFTRHNAVFWIAGDIPAGLRLDLPDGQRMPVPAPSSALPVVPAYFQGPPRAIAAETSVERSPAASAYARLLHLHLLRRLRYETGLSYTAACEYVPRSADDAQLLALVDTIPDRTGEAVRAFVEVLRGLARDPVTEEDLASVVTSHLERLRQPDADGKRLPAAAFDLLVGRQPIPIPELMGQIEALTPATILDVARKAHESSLLMVPPHERLEWAGLEPAPTSSRFAVTGRSYPSRTDRANRLIIGPEGVSYTTRNAKATVLYDDCVAVLAYPDGGRQIVGADGIQVAIEPALYRLDASGDRLLNTRIDAGLVVAMPARDRAEVPQASWAARRRVYRGRWRLARRDAQVRYRTGKLRRFLSPRRLFPLVLIIVVGFAVILSGGYAMGVPAGLVILSWVVRSARSTRRRQR